MRPTILFRPFVLLAPTALLLLSVGVDALAQVPLTPIAPAVARDTSAALEALAALNDESAVAIPPGDTAGLRTGLLWAETITAAELREHAFVLADDSFQGRETGTEGQRRAAAYLAGQVDALGLGSAVGGDSHQQSIRFESFTWDTTSLRVADEEFKWLRGYYALPGEVAGFTAEVSDVLFLGYGIDTDAYSDYAAAGDLTGRVAVVLSGEPFGKTGNSIITGTSDTSAWSRNGDSLRLAAAERAGLKALLVVEPDLNALVFANMSRILERGMRAIGPDEDPTVIPSTTSLIHINSTVFEALVGKRRRKVVRARKRIAAGRSKREPIELSTTLTAAIEPERKILEGSNVLAYIPGSDPSVSDEVVVVSAHYDHLGMRGETVYNGADDNASGTSTVLEIAEALAAAQRVGQGPRRSVLCLWVSGEEKGLLGSQYYAENPVLPLESTIADINIDMIGRYDEAHADSTAYIYVIGAGRISPDLDAATRAINSAYAKLDLDYTFDAEDDPNRFYFRSDHYNFAKSGIPSVFFFSGVHEDYHRPTDTPDKLDYKKMELVGRNAFLLAWNLANREGELNRITEEAP